MTVARGVSRSSAGSIIEFPVTDRRLRLHAYSHGNQKHELSEEDARVWNGRFAKHREFSFRGSIQSEIAGLRSVNRSKRDFQSKVTTKKVTIVRAW